MKQFLRLFVFSVLFAVSGTLYAQQDAQFSQYMFNGLYINPAYAGYRQHLNLNAFYRTQWVGFPGAPKTFSLAVDGATHNNRVGLGLQVMNDRLGAQSATSFYGSYAYRIPMNDYGDRTLAIGIGAGLMQQKLDVGLLHASDYRPDDIINSLKTKILPDAKLGVFYNSERFYAGLSADNLISGLFQKNEKIITHIPLKPHIYFTVGGLVPLSENFLLKPSLLVKEDLAGPTSLDLNSFLLINKTFWVGASYRTAILNKKHIDKSLSKSAVVAGMVEVFLNEKLRIGYSYDQTINGTVANDHTTHEMSLNYSIIPPKARMLSPRYF